MASSNEHYASVSSLLKESGGPLSADEIRHGLGARNISQATVYRIIKAGVQTGDFKEVSLPAGPNRYELAGIPHHHHFVCEQCDRVFDFDGCPKNISSLVPEGFQVKNHEIILNGVCLTCSQVT